MTLFLSGYSVPLEKVRYVWFHHGKTRKEAHANTAPIEEFGDFAHIVPGLSNLLMQALIRIGNSLDSSHDQRSVASLLNRGQATLGNSHPDYDIGPARQLWRLWIVVSSALESSSFMREVSDEEMRVARYYVGISTEFLRRSSDQALQGEVIEAVGPPLFTLALVLLRTGLRAILDNIFVPTPYPGTALRPMEPACTIR